MTKSATSIIHFPFDRGVEYCVAELKSFADKLSRLRRVSRKLSDELRCPPGRNWVKPWNEELGPVLDLATHECLPGDARIRLMLEGDSADVQLINQGFVTSLQITVADPIWSAEGIRTKDRGSQHYLEMAALNRYGFVSGWGPYKKDGPGILNRRDMISNDELVTAYLSGLIKAFQKKSECDGRGYELLVYARGFCKVMPPKKFKDFVMSAANTRTPKSFDRVYVVDYLENYFIELPTFDV